VLHQHFDVAWAAVSHMEYVCLAFKRVLPVNPGVGVWHFFSAVRPTEAIVVAPPHVKVAKLVHPPRSLDVYQWTVGYMLKKREGIHAENTRWRINIKR